MVDFPPSSADPASEEDRDPRVVGVDSEDADDLVSALSSETGRELLAELYDEPGTPAALADRVGTSLQNAQYHLGKLEDGDLVEVIDTVYSEKGREMKVYGPTAQPLVLFAGNEEETVGLQSALKNLLGGVGALALASLVVQRLSTGRLLPSFSSGGDGGFGGSNNAADDTDGGQAATTTETAGSGSANGGSDGATTSVDFDGSTTLDEGTTVKGGAEQTTRAPSDGTRTTVENATDTVTESATTATRTTVETVTTTVREGGEAAAGLPPGLLFFAGGLAVLLLGFAVWYARSR